METNCCEICPKTAACRPARFRDQPSSVADRTSGPTHTGCAPVPKSTNAEDHTSSPAATTCHTNGYTTTTTETIEAKGHPTSAYAADHETEDCPTDTTETIDAKGHPTSAYAADHETEDCPTDTTETIDAKGHPTSAYAADNETEDCPTDTTETIDAKGHPTSAYAANHETEDYPTTTETIDAKGHPTSAYAANHETEAPTPQTTKTKIAPPPPLQPLTPKATRRAPTPQTTKPKTTPRPLKPSTPKATRGTPTPQTTKLKVAPPPPLKPSTPKATRAAPTPQTTKPKIAPPPPSTPKVTQGAPMSQATKPKIAPPPPQKASTPKATRKAPTPQTTKAKVTRPPPSPPSTQTATTTAPTPQTRKPTITTTPPLPPPTPTPTTTTLPPLDERAPTIESVICTVDGEHWLDVPPDGVCQFIFFSSLKAPFENLDLSTPAGFANFKRFAAMGNQTQFGVSIYAMQTDDFLAHISKPTAKEWAKKQLWDFNIYHWGVMNMHKVITGLPDYFENALLSLKRAAHISKLTAKKEVASYTFIGFYGEKQVACEKAAQHFKKIYRPHVVVFLGHISFKEQEITSEVPNFVCIILPPTIYKIPPKIKQKLVYGHTYEEAAKMVTCISQKGINPPPVYAVSVTLQARSYTPKVDDTNEHKIGAYAVFEECDRFSEYATPHGVSTMMQDQRCTVHQK
ncbi:uncharacterized protein LOC142591475 [Dermacentor variabilis]|uniref:uncharacterized protein LOC142591475 n=1 Tax=Dermacentor variabilis TaxID=34621 RepID=UPI003F5B30CD